MANGQQEQQQLPQVGTQKQPSLYQTLGSMSAEELMKFKGFMHEYKGQQQITRNVGIGSAATLMSEVKSGGLSITEAVDQSKKMLTEPMKLINQQFFKPDMTSKSMLILKDRTGGNWTRTEHSLWQKHHDTIVARENKQKVAEGKMSKQIADNDKIARNARVTYVAFEDAVFTGMKSLFNTSEIGEVQYTDEGKPDVAWKKDAQGNIMEKKDAQGKKVKVRAISQENLDVLNEKWGFIQTEVAKDLNPATYGQSDQREMFKALYIVSHLIPEDYLRSKKGFMVGDEFISTSEFDEVVDTGTLRGLYYEKLKKLLMRAKGQIADVDLGGSESEFPTISTQDAYDALSPGTIFIDPNGDKRTKP
tara:strand:+ start:239 stop:1324 length:1086 start_codon:yes stop_codon:yes gene_type:complete